MNTREKHIRYLPIADRYEIHDPHDCNEGDDQCRTVRVAVPILDQWRAAQDLTKATYDAVRYAYNNGSL
jgi:hypothetical protein